MRKHVRLAIKDNNAATNDPCAVCGARTDPIIGPELFLVDSYELVCYRCGEKHYRALMVGLRAAQEAWRAAFEAKYGVKEGRELG